MSDSKARLTRENEKLWKELGDARSLVGQLLQLLVDADVDFPAEVHIPPHYWQDVTV